MVSSTWHKGFTVRTQWPLDVQEHSKQLKEDFQHLSIKSKGRVNIPRVLFKGLAKSHRALHRKLSKERRKAKNDRRQSQTRKTKSTYSPEIFTMPRLTAPLQQRRRAMPRTRYCVLKTTTKLSWNRKMSLFGSLQTVLLHIAIVLRHWQRLQEIHLANRTGLHQPTNI